MHTDLKKKSPHLAGGHPLPAKRGEGRGEGRVHFIRVNPCQSEV
jgi:hypothetical protein